MRIIKTWVCARSTYRTQLKIKVYDNLLNSDWFSVLADAVKHRSRANIKTFILFNIFVLLNKHFSI